MASTTMHDAVSQVAATQNAGNSPAAGWLAKAFSGFTARVGAALSMIQHARMIRALYELSDDQLAKIGITREDIPQYAFDLIFKDDVNK